MTHGGTLVLRADAGSAIGTGHVMRCLALAQAWQDAGGRAVCAAALMPETLARRLENEGVTCAQIRAAVGSADDAEETLELVRAEEASWLVADGYRFSPDYLARVHEGGAKILALDDMAHLERYPVDVLLNQNLSATSERYAGKVGEEVTLLLGPRFSLLRREFRRMSEVGSALRAGLSSSAGFGLQRGFSPQTQAGSESRPHHLKRVLLTFGGGDAENFTGQLLANLASSGRGDFEILVLAGAANPHVGALRRAARAAPFRCEVRVNLENVAAAMAWADAAIAAAGSTVWELAAMRLPALIGAFEENQLVGLNALQRVPLFHARRIEELLQSDLAAELDRLPVRPAHAGDFDAFGAVRVVEQLRTADTGTALALSA